MKRIVMLVTLVLVSAACSLEGAVHQTGTPSPGGQPTDRPVGVPAPGATVSPTASDTSAALPELEKSLSSHGRQASFNSRSGLLVDCSRFATESADEGVLDSLAGLFDFSKTQLPQKNHRKPTIRASRVFRFL